MVRSSDHYTTRLVRLYSIQTFSRINTPTFLKPSNSSHLLAYEDGTDSVSKRLHIQFRRREITQKKAYNIQNMAKVWNQEPRNRFLAEERDNFFPSKVLILALGSAQLLSNGPEATSQSSRLTGAVKLTSHIYLWLGLRINWFILPLRQVRSRNALEQLRSITEIWYQGLLFTNWCTIELL